MVFGRLLPLALSSATGNERPCSATKASSAALLCVSVCSNGVLSPITATSSSLKACARRAACGRPCLRLPGQCCWKAASTTTLPLRSLSFGGVSALNQAAASSSGGLSGSNMKKVLSAPPDAGRAWHVLAGTLPGIAARCQGVGGAAATAHVGAPQSIERDHVPRWVARASRSRISIRPRWVRIQPARSHSPRYRLMTSRTLPRSSASC